MKRLTYAVLKPLKSNSIELSRNNFASGKWRDFIRLLRMSGYNSTTSEIFRSLKKAGETISVILFL